MALWWRMFYTKEMLDVMCQFQRKFSLRALLDNIEN